MNQLRPDVPVRYLLVSFLISVCIVTVGCGPGGNTRTGSAGSANAAGPKTGIVTGDMVFRGDGVFMIVKLDDGSEVSVRKAETASAPALNRGTKVELEPIKDSKNGDWKVVRVLDTDR